MSIEDVARETPSKIHKLYIDPFVGPEDEDLKQVADVLDIQ